MVGGRYEDQGVAERDARSLGWRAIGNDLWEKAGERIRLTVEWDAPGHHHRTYVWRAA